MYNLHGTSYSEDRKGLYIALGIASLSLVSYSDSNNSVMEYTNDTYVEMEVKKDEDSSESTIHAMNLAKSSLAEDWDSESDEHWESFL